jgi:hypothetical protein
MVEKTAGVSGGTAVDGTVAPTGGKGSAWL